MLNKMVDRDACCKIYGYVLASMVSAIFVFLPIAVIIYWKPYVLFCDTKLDTTNQVSEWCLTPFPNVYSYIQLVYWDN